MTSVTDEDYHLTFGLHSGIPLCCAYAFSEGLSLGGPCIECQSKGVTKKDIFSKYHMCDGNTPACVPYLERIGENAISAYKKGYRTDPYPARAVPDDAYGVWLQLPMPGELRDILKDDGWMMAHICWPGLSEYWYIYLRAGDTQKGKCGVCNTKFSLGFPTAGKAVR